MSFWKLAKDKAALNRLQEEKLHAFALREVDSGKRRDGLWAKAIIESGGSDINTKIAYLRLLVSSLRDEQYLESRRAEEKIAQDRAEAAAASYAKVINRTAAIAEDADRARKAASDEKIMRCIRGYVDVIKDGSAVYDTFVYLLVLVGGSIEEKGFLFSKYYLVRYRNHQQRIDNLGDLHSWFMKNVIPNL